MAWNENSTLEGTIIRHELIVGVFTLELLEYRKPREDQILWAANCVFFNYHWKNSINHGFDTVDDARSAFVVLFTGELQKTIGIANASIGNIPSRIRSFG